MTKARDISSLIGSSGQIDNTKITLDTNEIPNLDAGKITSGSLGADRIPALDAGKITTGTFADARISNSSVSQHATSFDDNKLVNDISTLALRQASDQNKSAYNTNSQSVDVFQDATGIDTTTNTFRSADEYISSSGTTDEYETGDKRSVYSITTSGIQPIIGNITAWIDGNFGENNTNSWYWENDSQSNVNGLITFDLGSGNSKVFTGAKIYRHTSQATSGQWKWRGSNNGSSWTDLSSVFEWGNEFTTEVTWSNTTAYRYINLEGQSTATSENASWQKELEFKVLTTINNATGNFTGTTITAPSSVSSMGAIITYQDQAGTNALNTDIVLQLSADGGSNYSTATLTALPDFSTGIKMAKVNDLAVTAGTSLKYKISFANQASGSKEARIRGVALQY
jgi:hypothetical protein